MVGFWGFGVLRFWGFEMVDGETLGTYSLLRPISQPLNLSTSYLQAKKANLFFERYLMLTARAV
jgi:hypothetical protein